MPDFTPRLNLKKPDQGNKTWEADVEAWADKLDEVSAHYVSAHIGGEAVDEEVILDGFKFDEEVDITAVSFYARQAPTSASLTIDFLKDQTPQSKSASLPAGSNKTTAAISGLSYTSLQEFGIKITNIGSTEAGAEITIIVHYNVKAIA